MEDQSPSPFRKRSRPDLGRFKALVGSEVSRIRRPINDSSASRHCKQCHHWRRLNRTRKSWGRLQQSTGCNIECRTPVTRHEVSCPRRSNLCHVYHHRIRQYRQSTAREFYCQPTVPKHRCPFAGQNFQPSKSSSLLCHKNSPTTAARPRMVPL